MTTTAQITALQNAIARAEDHLQTVRDDLALASLAGDLQKTRNAAAAARLTVNSVAGDLAELTAVVGTLVPDDPAPPVKDAPQVNEVDDSPPVTPLMTS